MATKNVSYILEGFTRYNRKSHANEPVAYRFANDASATYKYAIVGGDSHKAFKVLAWARTQRQALAFADRHGLGRFGYVVGKVRGGGAAYGR